MGSADRQTRGFSGRRFMALAGSLSLLSAGIVTGSAGAQTGGISGGSGGTSGGTTSGQPCTAPGQTFIITETGKACSPATAPQSVKDAVQAANTIRNKPYGYGGGHNWNWTMDDRYDCSGSVSWALHGGGWLSHPYTSGDFMNWGVPGTQTAWIKVYANGGHVWMKVKNPAGGDDGIRLDTSDVGGTAVEGSGPSSGPDWHNGMRSTSGYAIREPRTYTP